jgi:signal transduction histidine kinase
VLIDNILDLANVDAGIAELTVEETEIASLIEKARAGLAATFPPVGGEPSVRLSVKIADELPRLFADGKRMVQVLYNLLSNAARFAPKGSEILLRVVARGRDRIVFSVEDEGPGPTPEMTAALNGRVDMPGRQRGAGLGLAIVRTFVNLHGGTVATEARKPRGTRTTIILPCRAAVTAGAAE